MVAAAAQARAQTASSTSTASAIEVIATTPLSASDLDRDRLAVTTVLIGAKDIDRTGIATLTGAVLLGAPSAAINDVEGNVFQPDILFRGFTASPGAGTPQGLAIYVDGVRFNDAFGDTVNWDLIPPAAIQSATIEASNPVFGLNALGGAVDVRLKTGLSFTGANLTAYGGAYGRGAGAVEFGRRAGPFAFYATADVTHDQGFRRTSESQLYRLYVDLGWKGESSSVNLGVSGANDSLGNPGATPVQALAANIANIFTAPNQVNNRYLGLNLTGVHQLGAALTLQGVAYFHILKQDIPNGITEEVAPCDDGGGPLCNNDGSVVTGAGGVPVPDFLNGATYSGLSTQQLTVRAYGGSAQVTGDSAIAGKANHLAAGASFDGSDSLYAAVQRIGGFDSQSREFIGPGVIQDQPAEGLNPVRVRSLTRSVGLFAADVLTIAPGLNLNLSGRFNSVAIDLKDELGGPVNGRHHFNRFNPSAGLTWHLAPWLTVYGGYAESGRAPTPQELSCASAAAPCSLLNFFLGDPDLKQVVARSVEVGLRGSMSPNPRRRVTWSADYYRTDTSDDIIFEPTNANPNLAFFTNAGRTRRQGIEVNLRYDGPRLRASLGYAYTDAVFATPLLLNSSLNPAADANGQIQVRPGDRIPGIPRHRATLVLDYALTDRLTLGASASAQGAAYRFGDEANLTKPVSGYVVVDLNASYRATNRVTVFGLINNAFNERYDTYGAFGPVGDVPWPNVPGGVTDTRTANPGTPIAGYGGVRISF
ncbi:MAG: TonB-dependent receptor [Caulobacterales bacterium]